MFIILRAQTRQTVFWPLYHDSVTVSWSWVIIILSLNREAFYTVHYHAEIISLIFQVNAQVQLNIWIVYRISATCCGDHCTIIREKSYYFSKLSAYCKVVTVVEFITPFLFKQPNRRTNYPNLFCYKTLHVSGIFSAHHREVSTVHSPLVSFMQVFDDRFQAESGCAECTVENSWWWAEKMPETYRSL